MQFAFNVNLPLLSNTQAKKTKMLRTDLFQVINS